MTEEREGAERNRPAHLGAGKRGQFVAWILLTFLGLLGIHRFYMGKILTGVLYLLTGGLLGIGWLYDFCTLNTQIDELNRG